MPSPTPLRAAARLADRPEPLVALLALVLAALWLGPLPALASTAFSPHMMLHIGVVGIAAPLAAAAVLRLDGARAPDGVPLSLAIGTAAVEMLVVWTWHLPALHAAAGRSEGIFILQQASFLVAAGLVWAVAFLGSGRSDRAIGALVMATTFVHMTMLGVIFTMAARPLYPIDVCRGAFGFDPLEDQRFGGALMAVFGGLPYLAGAVALMVKVLSPGEEDFRRLPPPTAAGRARGRRRRAAPSGARR